MSAVPWREQVTPELDDFAHGAAGGFLFGVPLLYTMEMWSIGLTVSMGQALLIVGLAILLSVGFVVGIGFRSDAPLDASGIISEAIDAIGISLVVAVVTLMVLGRITPDMALDSVAGRIAVQLLPVSLGVAVANHILPRQGTRRADDADRDANSPSNATVRDLTAAAGGALLLSLNIAPTDEITIMAGELSERYLVGLVLFSLLITYVIVFEADFHHQAQRFRSRGVLQKPLAETVVSYLVALLVCAGTLWLVGGIAVDDSLGTILSRVVVLGFPGALGAAAGRLAV